MIHIIGDSHALTFQGASDVVCHWMGAATAHNLYKKYEMTKTFFDKITDKYWFCFGEIDCRIHIYRLWKKTGASRSSLIRDTVDNYLGAVCMFDSWNIAVMAVPPQGYQGNYFGYDHYAPQKLRQQFTDVFNFELENECLSRGIRFIDIWEDTEYPIEYFESDLCHIKKEIAVARLEEYGFRNC